MKSNSPATGAKRFKGTVMRSTGAWYKVALDDGETLDCRMAGIIRMEELKSTNPVAVGDRVKIEMEGEGGYIVELLPRRNFIPRKSVNLSKRLHILCANVDQALIVFTLDEPVTTLGFVDRLTVTCEAYGVEPIILFNKMDLIQSDEMQSRLEDYESVYKFAGYKVFKISSQDEKYLDLLKEILKDKVSFLAGRSGCGKSTLANMVAPGLDIKIGKISNWSGRGKHTTTFAEMFPLDFGGFIVDSPGFRDMELYGFDKSEISHFFPEFNKYLSECKYSDCSHTGEPGCSLIIAVEQGLVPESRYHTYLGMLSEGE